MMSSHLRVPTRAIKDAVKGREIEILEALVIDWQAGNPHITCPYPGHEDTNPSWRWDDAKARAFCSCIQGSHSILDVVMAKEGIDFDAAKVCVAEFLERTDLITLCTSEQHRYSHAASLIGLCTKSTRTGCARPIEARPPALPFSHLRNSVTGADE
jgi:hypothetical protein